MAYKIGVVGCGGRMGQMLVREIVGTKDCAFAGGSESPGSANLGRDAGEVAGIGAIQAKIGSDARALFTAQRRGHRLHRTGGERAARGLGGGAWQGAGDRHDRARRDAGRGDRGVGQAHGDRARPI